MTHPSLTPAHDFKCLRSAIGAWGGSGWQVRDDQSDPAPEVEEEQHADPGHDEVLTEIDLVPVDEADDAVVEPVSAPAPSADTTKKKG